MGYSVLVFNQATQTNATWPSQVSAWRHGAASPSNCGLHLCLL